MNALQPKSNNLPEMQPKTDAALSSPAFIQQNLIPGSENAIQGFNENLKDQAQLQRRAAEENRPTHGESKGLAPQVNQPQPI